MGITGLARLVIATLGTGLIAGCGAAGPPSSSSSSPNAPMASTAAGLRVVALISANAEWKILRAQLTEPVQHDTPFGEWFVHRLGGQDVVFFHGGYGKVSAAGSTQYAIGRWHPALLVNLGTCGGFGGERKVGDIVLASETMIYDIVELMGDPEEAIADFR